MIKNIFTIKHIGEERLGTFARVIDQESISHRYVDAPHEDIAAIDPLGPDLLIVMGGPIGAYQADYYPFLKDEIKLLEKRLAANKPTLGICLGSQLIAAALGAKVCPGDKGFELGWHPITVTEEGKQTPVAFLDRAHTSMFHWHSDTFDLPDGATLLASSANYGNQAYSWGENVLALQCHPEVTQRMLREWHIAGASLVTGPDKIADLVDLRAQTEKNLPVMQEQAKKFFRQWLAERTAA